MAYKRADFKFDETNYIDKRIKEAAKMFRERGLNATVWYDQDECVYKRSDQTGLVLLISITFIKDMETMEEQKQTGQLSSGCQIWLFMSCIKQQQLELILVRMKNEIYEKSYYKILF